MRTKQVDFWSGNFGKEYTDRNSLNYEMLNQLYLHYFGLTRRQMNDTFLDHLPRTAKILEVGCNTGIQLQALEQNGFKNLYGIELQSYAAGCAKNHALNIKILQGSGFEIPFRDNAFDLVFTSGVLIHIAPGNLERIIREIHRCSSRYIWGFEYYASTPTEINYRGHQNVLWKADFASIFQEVCPELRLMRRTLYPYVSDNETGNIDCMFLLEKL